MMTEFTISSGSLFDRSISKNRIDRICNATSKEQALDMGIWDKFKDLFCRTKKEKALELLYKIYHEKDPEDRVASYKELYKIVSYGCKNRFTEYSCDNFNHYVILDKKTDKLIEISIKSNENKADKTRDDYLTAVSNNVDKAVEKTNECANSIKIDYHDVYSKFYIDIKDISKEIKSTLNKSSVFRLAGKVTEIKKAHNDIKKIINSSHSLTSEEHEKNKITLKEKIDKIFNIRFINEIITNQKGNTLSERIDSAFEKLNKSGSTEIHIPTNVTNPLLHKEKPSNNALCNENSHVSEPEEFKSPDECLSYILTTIKELKEYLVTDDSIYRTFKYTLNVGHKNSIIKDIKKTVKSDRIPIKEKGVTINKKIDELIDRERVNNILSEEKLTKLRTACNNLTHKYSV